MRWFSRPLLSMFAALALTLLWINTGRAFYGNESVHDFQMPRDALYVEECGSCHTAYAPGFLPARSWQKIMGNLEDHFGDDASLDEPSKLAILRWLVDGGSDNAQPSDLVRRINRAIAPNTTPLQISETPFFRYMHDEVSAAVWKRKSVGSKANCGACHLYANQGRYAEREIRVPKY